MRAVSFAVLVLLACAACRKGETPLPKTERVEIELDAARAAAQNRASAWALEGTWALSDARDAWVVDLGAEIVVPIAQVGPLDLSTAFALRVPEGADRDDLSVECEMRLVTNSSERSLRVAKRSVHDAAHGWTTLHEQHVVRPEDDARLVLVVRAVDAPPGTRACFVPPTWSDTRRVKSKPNVLIVSVDALRADRMQSQGYSRPTTPRIDTFLARGTRFQHAQSVAPWTLPSYGTLFTGLMPARHRAGISPSREGSFLDGRALEPGDFEMLDASVETLAGRFAGQGWRTAGFVSNPYLDGAVGIGRGCARWVMYSNRAAAGVELATGWIREQGSAPWFCFLHLMDPHAPYTPPAPFDREFAGAAPSELMDYPPTLASLRETQPGDRLQKLLVDFYDGEIASTDAAFGRLVEYLDAQGLTQETLVVFHSDHGEEFWEHGGYEHGHSLHQELLHVPLGFVFPGRVPAGQLVEGFASTLDVGPTILDLAGLGAFEAAEGRTLRPAFGAEGLKPRLVASEALLYGAREQKCVIQDGWKLITDGGDLARLYDLAHDPRELRDLARERPLDVERLRGLLQARARGQARPAIPAPRPSLNPARRAELEKLGYPGGAEHR